MSEDLKINLVILALVVVWVATLAFLIVKLTNPPNSLQLDECYVPPSGYEFVTSNAHGLICRNLETDQYSVCSMQIAECE